jgi:hypothetical protein
MAAVESGTFLISSQNIIKIFNENINNSKNISRDIKSNLIKCVNDLMDVIKSQNKLIYDNKDEYLIELKKQSQQHLALFTNINEKMASIESQLPKKSFAEVVGKQVDRSSTSKQRHVVVIRPSDESKTSQQTEDLIKSKVKPNQLKIGIKSKRRVSKGGLVIECCTEEECDSLSKEINKNIPEVKAEKPTKKKPTLIIRNVNNNIDSNKLLDIIVDNNSKSAIIWL